MHSQTRYELRFEKGKRKGERLPLAPGVHTLGRSQENAIVLADPSVSARHAELVVSEDEVRVTDLDSTNGVRVGARRVDTLRLAHGDRIVIGVLELVLVDRRFAAEPGADDPPALSGEALGELEADRLVRGGAGGRGPTPPWIALALTGIVLAAAALGARWWLRQSPRAQAALAPAAVPAVAGNRLASGSFEEGEPSGWTTPPGVPRAMRVAGAFAATGSGGLGVELGVGEWSLMRSPPFAVDGLRALRLGASLSAHETAGATSLGAVRLGLQRLVPARSTPAGAPQAERRSTSWAPALSQAERERVELTAVLAPGWEEACVVVAARGPGSFALDDVAVLPVERPQPVASFLEDQVFADRGAGALSVVRGGKSLVEATLSGWNQGELRGAGNGALEATAVEDGLRLEVTGPDGAALEETLTLLLQLPGQEPWTATLGQDGFRSHAADFAARATDVVFGAGIEAIRLGLGDERSVRGRREGQRLRLSFPVTGGSQVHVQLRFRAALAEAALLRERALAAEQAGELGAALASWNTLLESVPFQGEQVREAEAAAARLVQSGLRRVEDVRRDLQRARFFELPELFREALRRARDTARAYRGTVVEPAAGELAAEIEAELAESRAREAGERARRLRALAASGVVQRSSALAARLRQALDEPGRPEQERR